MEDNKKNNYNRFYIDPDGIIIISDEDLVDNNKENKKK